MLAHRSLTAEDLVVSAMEVGDTLADANAPAASARTNAVDRSTREMTVLAEFAQQKAKLLA